MASDDVIELGSSDEDTEPAPKKRKPLPNAMVLIPEKLKEITITAAKSSQKINPACIAKGTIGKAVTVTKIPKTNVNPYSQTQKPIFSNSKTNGKQIKPSKQPHVKPNVQTPFQKRNVTIPIVGIPVPSSPVMYKTGINPLKGLPSNAKVNNLSVTGVNPLNNMIKIMKPNVRPVKFSDNVKTATGPKVPKSMRNLSILPPGITVKRTGAMQLGAGGKQIRRMPHTVVKMSKPSVITTVDLDDEEPDTASASASGPQWYLRPEDRMESQQKKPIELLHTLGHGSKEDLKDETEQAIKPEQNTSPVKSPKKSLCVTEKSESVPEADIEKQNNKEPDRSTFVEITIEDSPLKPAPNKKGFKVGAELAITIEDSPVKTTADIPTSSCHSGDEETVSPKDPHSKKKLEYSKETLQEVETIEIEFEPIPSEEEPSKEDSESDNKQTNTPSSTDTNTKEKSKSVSKTEIIKTDDITKFTENKTERSKAVIQCSEIVEIEDSPLKALEKVQTMTPKKNKVQIIETVVIDDKEKDEFHPMYLSFINLCFRLENSDDMKKIVEKKIKSYYRQVPKDYTESEAFIEMVSSKIMAMKASPEKMYLYIKDVVDELNLQRKIVKMHPPPKDTKNEEQEKFLYGEDSEFDSKRQRQIRKLEKTLKKLHRAIQKLEEQEVDFDDEEDSVYLLTDSEDVSSSKDDKPLDKEVLLQRYKERMVRVHAKLCQLTNTKMPSEARVHIDARPGQPKGPAKRLDKWINRKVPIGTPLPFPDFHDVLRCVRDANQEDKLGWNEADIMEEARDLFTRCGKKLQRRRQENEWRLAASRIPADVPDPAEDSNELKKKLEDNTRMAAKRETEVLNKYADRQNQLNLEAVEIGDKEAEESPVESDDEESVEDNASLTSKERRKERLKRLLQEKSKKVSNEKENQSEKPSVVVGNSQKEDLITKDPNKAEINQRETKKSAEQEDEKQQKEDSSESKLPNEDTQKSELPEKVHLICKNKDDNETQSDKVHSLSDDSNKVESDIDELHLLQKLYSENELNTSVMDSSDSGTPIAISDSSTTEVSSDERKPKKLASDVISIENSSYSESEEKKGTALKDTETDTVLSKEAIKETVEADMEIEYSNDGVDKKNKENKKEKRKSIEDILLASSDEGEDTKTCKKNQPTTSDLHHETSINLRDDSISIGETVIAESRKNDNVSEDYLKTDHFDKNTNTDASSVEGMEIGPGVQVEEQNGLERDIVDTESIKSTDEGSVTEITSIKSTEEENAIETTSVKSIETIEDGNSNESAGVKTVETIEDGNGKESTSIKSDKAKDYAHANDTNVKSVESVEDGNSNESTSIKSVETVEDTNANETSIKSVETIEDGNGNDSTSIKSVETINDANANETSIKSVETIEDENDNESTSIKSVETIEDDLHPNELSVQSDETMGCAKVNESTTFKTISITEDTNSDDIEDVNANEMTSSNSVESIEDANGNEPKLNIKTVETLEDANTNKISSIKSIENKKDVDDDVSATTSTELFQDVILSESIEYSQKRNVSPMDTSDNVDATMKKARQYNDSLPEPMEVDSNTEHT